MNTFVRRDAAYVNNSFFVVLHKLQMYIKVGIKESKYEKPGFRHIVCRSPVSTY